MRYSTVVSYILHPVFMPLLGAFIIFNSGIYISELPAEFKRFVYTMVFLCTTVLPLTLLPALYLFKTIQKITLDERRERLIPLFFTTLCFYAAYFLITKFSPVRVINHFLFAGVITVLAVLLVSLFWKLSIHMAGMGGITALIVILSIGFNVDMTIYLSIAILLTGVSASARLDQNAHSMLQLTAGYFLGLTVVGVIMFSYL